MKPVKKTIARDIAQLFRKNDSSSRSEVRGGEPEQVATSEGCDESALSLSMEEGQLAQKVCWNLEDVKRKVSQYVHQGRITKELADILCVGGMCAPVEYELLDYKETFVKSSYETGKLVRRVVSFYNSYGGLLVFGVREVEAETCFSVVGVAPEIVEIESLKASVKEFTGERVQVSITPIEVTRSDGTSASILFLHIPQRSSSLPPLHFTKDGPSPDRNSKPIFVKDSVYYRRSDECIEAKGPRILELNSERRNPYLEQDPQPLAGLFRVTRISHNLPDRNFVCPRFIGRDGIVNALWRWLGDDLSHAKVLAGEGGLGKSSIAYEFAERVSETPGVPFEQVVWLTAKEKQFKAFEDQYFKVPERHYTTYDELLLAICHYLPFTADEIEGATPVELRRMIKRGLMDHPSLIVVDDVDSLSSEEQRQVLELGMILGSSPSRILLTTRFNQSFSADNVIKLSGFSLDEEYPQYLEALRERLSFPVLSESEIEKIHVTSSGSPLFTESLLRLLRWTNVKGAIEQWKGERGSAVRAAALKREIDLLTPEAQRILLATAILGEASAVELCEVLGYTPEQIERGLADLISLFLVAAPALASVPRFRVPDNTRRLVTDSASTLVTDRARLEREIQRFRTRSGKSTKDDRVAIAISQAAALVRIGNFESALATIKDARHRTKDHFDLLSYQATLCLKLAPPKIDDARKLARNAYTKGCRKSEVFDTWFEAEWSAKNFVGALEATEAALENKAPGVQDWIIRKSASLAAKATDQAKSGSLGTSISTMFEASATLRTLPQNRDDFGEIENRQSEMHDKIWVWSGGEGVGLGRAAVQLDVLEKFWQLGDFRITNLRRLLSTFEGIVVVVSRKFDHVSTSHINLCDQLRTRSRELLKRRDLRFPSDSRHGAIRCSLESLHHRLEEAISLRTASIQELAAFPN